MRTFQGDDLARWIHDGRICRNGPPDGVGGVGEVNNDHLVRLAHLFADAYELVRLHRERREADVGGVDADIGELQKEMGMNYSKCYCYRVSCQSRRRISKLHPLLRTVLHTF